MELNIVLKDKGNLGCLRLDKDDLIEVLSLEDGKLIRFIELKKLNGCSATTGTREQKHFDIILPDDMFDYLALKLGYKNEKKPLTHWVQKAKLETYALTRELRRTRKEVIKMKKGGEI